jgi:hypothetical protein
MSSHYGEAAPTSGGRKGVGPYLNIYGDFITKNAHAVSQIESALRSLTYIVPGIIPGRKKCGEIQTQGGTWS